MREDDNVLKRALAKRALLRKEIEELDSFIAVYKKLARDLEPEIVSARGTLQAAAAQLEGALSTHARLSSMSSPQREIERAAKEILAKSDEPLSTAEILKRITARGLSVVGQNPRWNLSAKLSRAEGIVNIDGFGWWLTDRPCSAVGYLPQPKNEAPDAVTSGASQDEGSTSSSIESEEIKDLLR